MARDVLDGRFELQALLGSGGMAAVYRAWDRRGRRPCAVKVLADVLARDPEVTRRFRQEAAAAGALTHPYIVGVYGWGQDGLRQFIAMEYVGGGTLRERLQRDGPLPEAEALRLAAEVAAALAYAHERHVVHRDIKPHNILLTQDGHVKVADFGIALTLDATALTRTGTVMGSAPYVSPEQVRGETAGPASDQYALGIVLYEMLSGRAPFSGEAPLAVAYKHLHETPRSLRAAGVNVSPATAALVDRLLTKAPQHRYPNAAALAAELHRLAGAAPALRRGATNGAAKRGGGHAPDATSRLSMPVGTVDATERLPRTGAIEAGPAVDGHQAPSAPALRPAGSRPAARAPSPADAGSVTQALPASGPFAEPGQTSSFAPIQGRAREARSDTARLRVRPRQASGMIVARTAIIVIGLVVGLAIIAAAYRAAWTAAHAVTPNLVGLTVADAGKAVQSARLGVLVTGTRQDTRAPFGVVLAQDPRPGVEVAKGTVINVTVSGGSGLVPDLGGQTVQSASGMLERAGLRLGRVSYAISFQVGAGRIVYQFQPAGSRLLPNAGVDVIVSQGFPRLPFLPQIGPPTDQQHEHGH